MKVIFQCRKVILKKTITSKNFLDSIEYRAMDLVRLVGVEYAEGFTV